MSEVLVLCLADRHIFCLTSLCLTSPHTPRIPKTIKTTKKTKSSVRQKVEQPSILPFPVMYLLKVCQLPSWAAHSCSGPWTGRLPDCITQSGPVQGRPANRTTVLITLELGEPNDEFLGAIAEEKCTTAIYKPAGEPFTGRRSCDGEFVLHTAPQLQTTRGFPFHCLAAPALTTDYLAMRSRNTSRAKRPAYRRRLRSLTTRSRDGRLLVIPFHTQKMVPCSLYWLPLRPCTFFKPPKSPRSR